MSALRKASSHKKQKASFAIEAAFVGLALVGLGMAFSGAGLKGGTAMSCDGEPTQKGSGLLKIMSQISCEIDSTHR